MGAAIDKKAAIAFCEVDMDLFSSVAPTALKYREASRFPGIDLDMTFAAKLSDVAYAEVCRVALAAAGDMLVGVAPVATYEKDGVETLTLRFSFPSAERTLAKAEIQPAADALVAALATLGLRQQA